MIRNYIDKKLDKREVYIMYIHRLKKVKIGISDDPERRENEVEKDFGKTRTWMALNFIGAKAIEKRMHRFFKVYHSPEKKGTGRTELFKIPAFLRWQVVVMLWLMKVEQMILSWLMFAAVIWVFWNLRFEILELIRIIVNL